MLQNPNYRLPLGHEWDKLNQVITNSQEGSIEDFLRDLSAASDKAVTIASRVDCGLMNTQALDCIDPDIKLLTNRYVNSDVTLIRPMYQYAILNLKRVIQHMVDTKANADVVELIKTPNNMQPKTSALKKLCTTI